MENQISSPICASEREALTKVGYDEIDLRAIEPYFSRMSDGTPRVYLARIFYWGRLRKMDLIKIMIEVDRAWEETWKHGSPDRLGDPDDVGGPSMENTSAFFQIYKHLDLPWPKCLAN
jgi:hypothetical protein